MLLPLNLKLTLNIKPILGTKSIPNVTSLALCLQSKILYIRELKDLDYILTNFFSN